MKPTSYARSAFTGARLSELLKLRAEHYDPRDHTISIRGTKTRASNRRVPLFPMAEEIIARRAKDRPKGPLFDAWGHVQRDLDLACRRVERKLNPNWEPPEGKKLLAKKDRSHGEDRFECVSPNDLRGTFASYLANGEANLFTASRLMGHASTAMIQHVYAQLASKTLAGGIEQAARYLAESSTESRTASCASEAPMAKTGT